MHACEFVDGRTDGPPPVQMHALVFRGASTECYHLLKSELRTPGAITGAVCQNKESCVDSQTSVGKVNSDT